MLDAGADDYLGKPFLIDELMARLRAEQDVESVWARMSWRLLPFFAVCVLALTLWHGEVLAEVQDAQQVAYVENPLATDGWESLN